MSALTETIIAPAQVDVRRCLDQHVITTILRRDYFDDPIPHLSHGVIQTLAAKWIAAGSDVYLLTADVDGIYAGFVFGHTLGPRFWRLFARKHPSHLTELLWVAFKMRYARKAGRGSKPQLNGSSEDRLASQIALPEISTLPEAFAWSSDSRTGIIPLIFVHPDHRGKSVARHLLDGISKEMFRDGAKCVEAHIDLNNISSARAFLKAGFEVHQMASNDFWARKTKPTEQDS
jgi:RimJ/RimL family protein N-acetyltransferase